MKRLIVCCDGTWNTPEQEENNAPCPTNVVRLYNALAPVDSGGIVQVKYYHPGVGSDGSLLSKTAGGIYGEGLDKSIKSAYAWLSAHYEEGDAIFLFGFSRGAYTVRSLGGLIGRCGLARLQELAPAEGWSRVEAAYQKGYQENKEAAVWRRKDWDWLEPGDVPIEFIGVWDTVGARGIPDDLAILNLLDRPEDWRFYDTRLGAHVKTARHAVAIDEMRASFTPTLWTDMQDQPIYDDATGRVKQVWFAGVHSDVGGGYAVTGLSDIALSWMIDEAKASGLAFLEAFLRQIHRDSQGNQHDSAKGVFKCLRTRPRNIPQMSAAGPFHPTVLDRQSNPPIAQAPYWPSTTLGVGQKLSFSVFASKHWNATGLYLAKGASYRFTAAGEWLDRTITCDPGGTNDGRFQLGEIAQVGGTLLGKFESLFGKLTGNDSADFVGTRRIEAAPWFSLVGAIANDGAEGAGQSNPNPDGSPSPHQYLEIGSGPYELQALARPGYLYAFANDAWHFYENNHGSVVLTVERTA